MRNIACDRWVELANDPSFVFLTGDLGFMALEPLKEALGERFINAGIAEQNMLSVACGLAIEGMRPWVYSIAPFCYARPFEQIRNDVCQHNLSVILVGNGGGYAYGAMGASHHALEDYGSLLTLPNISVFVPAFAADLPIMVNLLRERNGPAYLRLGRSEQPADTKVIAYAKWRKILPGAGMPVVVVGPLAGEYWRYFLQLGLGERPELWVLGELPVSGVDEMPAELVQKILERGVCFVEEHTCQGSAAQQVSHLLMSSGIVPKTFRSFHTTGYPTGRYGSQSFHRDQSGITPHQVISELGKLS